MVNIQTFKSWRNETTLVVLSCPRLTFFRNCKRCAGSNHFIFLLGGLLALRVIIRLSDRKPSRSQDINKEIVGISKHWSWVRCRKIRDQRMSIAWESEEWYILRGSRGFPDERVISSRQQGIKGGGTMINWRLINWQRRGYHQNIAETYGGVS